ncbi:hypothetical protein ABPG74_003284 [Tetrahymena malaccensis]
MMHYLLISLIVKMSPKFMDGFKNRFEQSLPKNYKRSRSQSQDKKIQSEFQGKKIQQENDLVLNDFKCNIDMIDPNMFFNNNQLENEEQIKTNTNMVTKKQINQIVEILMKTPLNQIFKEIIKILYQLTTTINNKNLTLFNNMITLHKIKIKIEQLTSNSQIIV